MFERLENLIGKENFKKLNSSNVLVLGIGGVGGYVATSLVRNGIGNITIVDFDKVEESNINRQIIAYHSTLGLKKVQVLKSMLLDINSSVKISVIDEFIDKDNINILFKEKYDYMIDCCDYIETKKAFILNCINKNINFISSMGTANKLNPKSFEIIDIRKTSYDPIAKILRNWVKKENIDSDIFVLCSNEPPIKNRHLGTNAIDRKSVV